MATENKDENVLQEAINSLEAQLEAAKIEAGNNKVKECPYCGYNFEDHTPLITDEDKQEYMRSILGMRQFKKEYTLFNGELKVVMKALTSEESEKLNSILRTFIDDDPNLIIEKAIKIRMLLGIEKVVTPEREIIPELPEKIENVSELFSKTFNCPEPVLRLLSNVFNKFSRLMEELAKSVFTTDFYKGGGVG